MRGLVAVSVVLGLAGCVRLMGQTDGGTDLVDLGRDQAPPDVPPPDAPPPDAPPLDAPPLDAPPLDAPLPCPDQGGPVCAPGAIGTTVGTKAVLCVHKNLSYAQCDAHNLCNKGAAALCNANQYQNRIKHGIATPAWIAGCVRMGGAPVAPKSATCGVCTSFVTSSEVVEWLCSPASIGVKSTDSHLGLVTHTDCRRVGEDQAATESFWRTSQVGIKLSAAVCCD